MKTASDPEMQALFEMWGPRFQPARARRAGKPASKPEPPYVNSIELIR